jgi:hypothetical protein
MTIRRAGAAGEVAAFLIAPDGSPIITVNGHLSVNMGRWFGSLSPTVGQKTMASSIPVVIASNQTVIPVIGTEVNGVAITGTLLAIAGVDVLGNARRFLMAADGTAKAREDIIPMTWVSGITTAPAANAVIADTGQLTAGDYDFDVQMGIADSTAAVGKCLILEHRNAANAATLFNLALIPQQDSQRYQFRRVTIATNERLRVINGAVAGAAASRYHGAIGRRVS